MRGGKNKQDARRFLLRRERKRMCMRERGRKREREREREREKKIFKKMFVHKSISFVYKNAFEQNLFFRIYKKQNVKIAIAVTII